MSERSDIHVRLLKEEDVAAYMRMFSPAVRKVLRASCYWHEFDYVHTKLRNQKNNKQNNQIEPDRANEQATAFYGIFLDTSLIGALEIRSPEYRGQLYTWLHEDYWGKGIFQVAFKQICQEYFTNNPEANSITATVDVSNIQSYKALLKAGFTCIAQRPGPYEDQFELSFEKL